jgi:hypothetical protein
MHQSASGAAEMYHHEQRDAIVLLLCMTFMLESLSSFLSLLTFDPSGSGAACGERRSIEIVERISLPDVCLVFVIAATTIASQVTRVFGLMILGNDLRHHIAGQWELYLFWVLLGLGTGSRRSCMRRPLLILTPFSPLQVLSGVTVGVGTGHLA